MKAKTVNMNDNIESTNKKQFWIINVFLYIVFSTILLWVYYFWTKIIYLFPVVISVLSYKFYNKEKVVFNEDKKMFYILISLFITLSLIVFIPIVSLLSNNFYVTYSNFVFLFQSKEYIENLFLTILIVLLILIVCIVVLFIYDVKLVKYHSFFNYYSFINEIKIILNRLSSSKVKKISIENCDRYASNYLLKNKFILKNKDNKICPNYNDEGEIYLIIKRNKKINIVSIILFLICCFVFLIGFTVSKEDILNGVITDNTYGYSMIIPNDYVVNNDGNNVENSDLYENNKYELIYRNDISGNSGTIYIEKTYLNNTPISDYSLEDDIELYNNEYYFTFGVTDYQIKTFINKNGFVVIRNILVFDEYYDVIDYVYITSNDYYTKIKIEYIYPEENMTIKKDAQSIVQSVSTIEWE